MSAAVDLWWLPLGAGGRVVPACGRAYEAVAAALARRERRALYHAALLVTLAGELTAIELAPAWGTPPGPHGVVATGSVGVAGAGRLPLLRYEVRRWRGGAISDLDHAAAGPITASTDPAVARRLLELVPAVPLHVWGRDAVGAGDMWNSNSVIAWLLLISGAVARLPDPPAGGRAPGWRAGAVAAQEAGASLL
ncbi:MAG: hypothetical protein AB7V42_02165 [Thermoleophilia bacterium]